MNSGSVRIGRGALVSLLPVIAFASLSGCRTTPAGDPLERLGTGAAVGRNLLLITLDTTRADRLGCYGHAAAATPELDSLAAEGARFADAVSVVPVTLPSHASILTGLYPPRHGVRDNGEYRLGDDATTLAELFRDAGHETAAFVSAFVLDHRYGLDQGFERYDDRIRSRTNAVISDLIDERDAAAVTDAALDWLARRDGSRPFFGWVHYFDPHQPYQAPDSQRERTRNGYDAEIAHVDSQIGRLLDRLRSDGTDRETVVLVVADHGEGLGEHGEETHTLLIYGSTMRVPLIAWAPGLIAPGQVVDRLVATVDLVPTAVELWGLADPGRLDGSSLLAADVDGGRRRVYMESLVPFLDYAWAPLYGMRRTGDKLIRAPEPEYYDLVTDRDELDNLYTRVEAERLARRESLERDLAERLANWPDASAVAAAAMPLDARTLARLESLGYAGGADPDPGGERLDPKSMMPVLARLAEAKSLARANRLEEASALLDELSRETPPSRVILGQIAQVALSLGREADAERALESALAIKPDARALVMLGQMRLKRRELGEAAALLEQSVAVDPDYGAAYVALGDLAAEQGRLDDAKQAYTLALERDPHRVGDVVKTRLAVLRRFSAARGDR